MSALRVGFTIDADGKRRPIVVDEGPGVALGSSSFYGERVVGLSDRTAANLSAARYRERKRQERAA